MRLSGHVDIRDLYDGERVLIAVDREMNTFGWAFYSRDQDQHYFKFFAWMKLEHHLNISESRRAQRTTMQIHANLGPSTSMFLFHPLQQLDSSFLAFYAMQTNVSS